MWWPINVNYKALAANQDSAAKPEHFFSATVIYRCESGDNSNKLATPTPN